MVDDGRRLRVVPFPAGLSLAEAAGNGSDNSPKAIVGPHAHNVLEHRRDPVWDAVRAVRTAIKRCLDLLTENLSAKAATLVSLKAALDRFYDTLDAATVPAEGGARKVGGFAHAVALSETTTALYGELGAAHQRLIQQHGQPTTEYPTGLVLMESDSLDGLLAPIPASAVRIAQVDVGGNARDAMLLASLESRDQSGGVPDRQVECDASGSPWARRSSSTVPPRRRDPGESDLAVLECAAKLLRMATPTRSANRLVGFLLSASHCLPRSRQCLGRAKAIGWLGKRFGPQIGQCVEEWFDWYNQNAPRELHFSAAGLFGPKILRSPS